MDEKIIDEIRYDEKTNEFLVVFKGKDKFNEFCNRIQYLTYLAANHNKARK